jgi:hypothetical protein
MLIFDDFQAVIFNIHTPMQAHSNGFLKQASRGQHALPATAIKSSAQTNPIHD